MSDQWSISGLQSDYVWDYENGYHWFSSPSRMDKALAHYELYKRVLDLPGHVLEFGVYKAASLIRLATFRRLLETDTSRKIVGFDAFGAFPQAEDQLESDAAFVQRFEEVGGDGLSEADVRAVLDHKGFTNVELVAGNILTTLPEWLKMHPETQIALLHLDVDVYQPSRVVLDLCYERVVSGGIIMFDDFNSVEGETRAANELIDRYALRIRKLPYYTIPSYIEKP